MFLWEQYNNNWYGVYGSHIIKLCKNENRSVEVLSFPEMKSCKETVFRLDDDFAKILQELSKDSFVNQLIKKYPGLRLMRQEPHQCLFSFLCASNTNIPMIRKMLYALTRRFGKKIQIDGKLFFTFPSALDISRATIDELRSCSLGYRAKAIRQTADDIVSGRLDLDLLRQQSYEDARQQLLKTYGVGNKIADCVLLFSLDKLNAFPIDIWIARAITSQYSWLFRNKYHEKLTTYQYELLSKIIRQYFGKYAGYAQQYIYYHMRQELGKKW